MHPAKFRRLESALNGMARKVLAAVPIQEAWSTAQISSELRRVGTRADISVIEGCLGSLLASGLIKRPSHDSYTRIEVTSSLTEALEKEPTIVHHIEPTSAPKVTLKRKPIPVSDTLTRLAESAAALRKQADEIDAIALEVEERVRAAGKDGEKLRQLQALLKGITDVAPSTDDY